MHLIEVQLATTVKIREEFISLNKKYNVHVDGNHVATVSGEYVNITGDVFALTDGNVLFIIEKQIDIVDAYTIVKQNPDAEISMKDVIFLTCIVDAIEDASEEESKKSSGS